MIKYPRKSQSPSIRDWSSWDKARIIATPLILREGDVLSPNRKPYDLEERAAQFGEGIIRFAKKIPHSPVNNRLINQLVGAATSIGANFCEADEGVSGKDFRHRISTCKKEARETKFFLRMIAAAEPGLGEEARELWREAKQLHLIFCAIYRKKSLNIPKYPNTP